MSTRPLRVATVEDQAVIRLVLTRAFEARGDAVVVAESDGDPAGLDALLAAEPDIVLVDQALGRHRGTDLLGVITQGCPRAMVAMLTSHDDAPTRRLATDAGAFTVYGKSELSLALLDRIVADHERFVAGLPPGD